MAFMEDGRIVAGMLRRQADPGPRRVVRGDKELLERLGRNDLCPCGSWKRFQAVLPEVPAVRRVRTSRVAFAHILSARMEQSEPPCPVVHHDAMAPAA